MCPAQRNPVGRNAILALQTIALQSRYTPSHSSGRLVCRLPLPAGPLPLVAR